MRKRFDRENLALFFAFLVLSWSPAASAEFPRKEDQQVIVEWNSQSDVVGSSHVKESREAFENFVQNYLHAPSDRILKVPDTANLDGFTSQLKSVLSDPKNPSPRVLRIFVNAHGSTDSFQSRDANTNILWDDFVKSLADSLRDAKRRPETVELYLSPCFSGSIIPSLKQRLNSQAISGTEINVWAGSSGFTTTSSPEFPDALKAFADLDFTLSKFLTAHPECAEGPSREAALVPLDLIGSLSGTSFSEFWTNSGKVYRKLTNDEFEELLTSNNPFLIERALTSLLREGGAPTKTPEPVIATLKNAKADYYLRTLAAEYLGRFSGSEIAAKALFEVAKDPGTKNSAQNIRAAAIEAAGFADSKAYDHLTALFNDQNYTALRGSILKSMGATKDARALSFVKKFLESEDSALRSAAQEAYFLAAPAEALAYFEAKLAGPSADPSVSYSIGSAISRSMPADIAPSAARLLIKNYKIASGANKLYALQLLGGMAKQAKASRATLKNELFPLIEGYAKAQEAQRPAMDDNEARLRHESRIIQFILEE